MWQPASVCLTDCFQNNSKSQWILMTFWEKLIMLYEQSQRATGVSHNMWRKELFGGGLRSLSAFLFITVETATSENWILNIGRAREVQCFFILHNRKLAFFAFSQKTLSVDFASRCARWNFCTWKKRKRKIEMKLAPPLLEEMNCV